MAAAATGSLSQSKASVANNLGIPGPYPGRVIAVEHPGSIIAGVYQKETIQQMVRRGMTELTQAPSWQDAWRTFFEKGDVVEVHEKSRMITKIMASIESVKKREIPNWLEADHGAFKGTVKDMPTRENVTLPVEENMIVEYYSR